MSITKWLLTILLAVFCSIAVVAVTSKLLNLFKGDTMASWVLIVILASGLIFLAMVVFTKRIRP